MVSDVGGVFQQVLQLSYWENQSLDETSVAVMEQSRSLSHPTRTLKTRPTTERSHVLFHLSAVAAQTCSMA